MIGFRPSRTVPLLLRAPLHLSALSSLPPLGPTVTAFVRVLDHLPSNHSRSPVLNIVSTLVNRVKGDLPEAAGLVEALSRLRDEEEVPRLIEGIRGKVTNAVAVLRCLEVRPAPPWPFARAPVF